MNKNNGRLLEKLGIELKGRYDNAPRKEQVISIFLFALEYHKEILECGIREVVETAGLPKGYVPEMSKAIKLAPYIEKKAL